MDRDQQLRDYAELAQALTELEKHPGWQVLADRILNDSNIRHRHIVGGTLNQEEYRFDCGWLAGIQHALAIPDKVRKEYDTLRGDPVGEE